MLYRPTSVPVSIWGICEIPENTGIAEDFVAEAGREKSANNCGTYNKKGAAIAVPFFVST